MTMRNRLEARHAASAPAAAGDRTARTAFLFVLVLTAANALFNIAAGALGFGFPYTSFLFRPEDNFADFFSLLASYPGGGPALVTDHAGIHALLPAHALWAMPVDPADPPAVTNLHMTPLSTAAALAMVRLLRWFDPVMLFLGLLGLMAAGWWAVVRRACARRSEAMAWLLLGFLAYPVLLMVVRGNLFAGVTALLLLAALLLAVERRRPVAAAILFACAVNIRPNAILFALPLLAFYGGAARWRCFAAITIAGPTIAATSLAIATAGYPAYGIGAFLRGLQTYYEYYAIDRWGLAYGSSLFGALKVLECGYRPGMDGAAMLVALAIAVAGFGLYCWRRIGDAGLLFLICAAYCLGSTVIGDYHLAIFLIVPIVLRQAEDWTATPSTRAMFVASCLMLAPKNYLFWGPISLQVVLNPAILLAATLAVIAFATASAGSGARRSCPRPDFAG